MKHFTRQLLWRFKLHARDLTMPRKLMARHWKNLRKSGLGGMILTALREEHG